MVTELRINSIDCLIFGDWVGYWYIGVITSRDVIDSLVGRKLVLPVIKINDMKIFISWSGELSKEIAEILRQWIPGVIQAAKPYYSPDDITKGTRWNSEISKELDSSKVGVICLTKENLDSPWIMFEAGALSKNLEKSKVCPLLFGIEPSDIKGPLVQFQASKFSKKEVKKVIKMMNDELESSSLSNDVLDSVFEMWWPKLEEQINSSLEKARNEGGSDLRTDRDLLEEVLSLTRRLSIERRRKGNGNIQPEAIDDLIEAAESLVEYDNSFSSHENTMLFIQRFYRAVEHIIEESQETIGINRAEELIHKLRRLRILFEDFSDSYSQQNITRHIRNKEKNNL